MQKSFTKAFAIVKNPITKNLNKIFTIFFLTFTLSSTAQGILMVAGKMVKDPMSGKAFVLRGVNLGGWLVTENWMCGIKDSTDNNGRNAIQMLEKRFSTDQVKELVNVWQNNWITATDLDKIKDNGMNFVRVPFGWRNLQDKNRKWLRTSNGSIDFSRLDWIVNEAAKRNLYVMLDYHIWLDQEKAYNTISDLDSVKQHTYDLWKEVASHFKGNPTVVAYDLLNEPTASWNDHVMDNIYKTIRAVDPDHIISIEWTNPDTLRWKNIIYQDHYYGSESRTLAEEQNHFIANFVPEAKKYHDLNVPFYIGEFHASQNGDEKLAWLLEQFCQLDIHWSPWTYKTNNMWGWGQISLYPNKTQVNLATDSFTDIYKAWSSTSVAANWYELTNVKKEWTKGARCMKITNPLAVLDENANTTELQCFPNPFQDYLNLKAEGKFLYFISDILGNEIEKGIAVGDTSVGHSLPNGLYVIKIQTEKLEKSIKVSKVR